VHRIYKASLQQHLWQEIASWRLRLAGCINWLLLRSIPKRGATICGAGNKPGSVRGPSFISDRDFSLPPATYPRVSAGPASSTLLFGLAPNGVCRACRVAATTGGLLPHHFTLTRHSAWHYRMAEWVQPLFAKLSAGRYPFCGTFQGSLPLGVTQRSALWSPDFPPSGTQFHGYRTLSGIDMSLKN